VVGTGGLWIAVLVGCEDNGLRGYDLLKLDLDQFEGQDSALGRGNGCSFKASGCAIAVCSVQCAVQLGCSLLLGMTFSMQQSEQ
jgi:hypothetical protein